MNFDQIIGQEFLKKYFKKTISRDRVPNTQMFVGDEGVGTLPMALAFASELLCKDNENCRRKVAKIIHPDLHFIFPSITKSGITKPCSEDFITEWREFITDNPYAGYYNWLQFLNSDNKQGMIRTKDAENILKKAAVKPYEAPYKVFIIWMVEKMNLETANKLLKILEEPPEDTKFILITENTEIILPTILSRCQVHYFNPIPVDAIQKHLIQDYNIPQERAVTIAHQCNGNWNKVLSLMQAKMIDDDFQKLFIEWVRIAFSAKKNLAAIQKLIKWSEYIAGTGREKQKQFLDFALQTFRQAMLINYQNNDLAYFDFSANRFDLNKLAPFIHNNNIESIYENINQATYYIERNANPKLIFLDLSIKLTKLIHTKEKEINN